MTAATKIQAAMENSSWIRKMFEEGAKRKAEFGDDNVFDFSLGNPNLEPPSEFKQIIKDLVTSSAEGQHAYMPNAGYEDTRRAVADYLSKNNNQTFSPRDIVMTVGAAGAMNVVLKTILNPGDEVIIPRPYFMEYDFYVDNHQGVKKAVPTKDDFSLDLEAIGEAVTARTKALLINSPNNPTGRIYSKAQLDSLGRLLKEHSDRLGRPIYLISDEPYRKIAYDGVAVPSIFNAYSESFVVNSFSKDLSLAGERIGYAAINPDISDRDVLVAGLVLCNRIIGFVNAPALMQRVVSGLLEVSVDVSIYQRKRDMLFEALSSFGYEITRPEGAFYLFPKSPIQDDVEFVSALQEENILTVPGRGLGGPGHFRIAYCVPDRVIERSLPAFERAIKRYIKG